MKFDEVKVGDIVYSGNLDYFEEYVVIDKENDSQLVWICSRALKRVQRVSPVYLEKSKIEILSKHLVELEGEKQKQIADYDERIANVNASIKRIAEEEDAKI